MLGRTTNMPLLYLAFLIGYTLGVAALVTLEALLG
jgi:hypothetical protein